MSTADEIAASAWERHIAAAASGLSEGARATLELLDGGTDERVERYGGALVSAEIHVCNIGELARAKLVKVSRGVPRMPHETGPNVRALITEAGRAVALKLRGKP